MSDVMALGGLAALASGLYLVSLELMLIVIGTILLAVGVIGAWRQGG